MVTWNMFLELVSKCRRNYSRIQTTIDAFVLCKLVSRVESISSLFEWVLKPLIEGRRWRPPESDLGPSLGFLESQEGLVLGSLYHLIDRSPLDKCWA